MYGPQHYTEAESLIERAAEMGEMFKDDLPNLSDFAITTGQTVISHALAEAQIHATLALAAATIDASSDMDDDIDIMWVKAMS